MPRAINVNVETQKWRHLFAEARREAGGREMDYLNAELLAKGLGGKGERC